MKQIRRIDCGFQHHFIGICSFHLTTFLEDLVVSTVGHYRGKGGEARQIGPGRYYETFVYRTDNDWSEKTDERYPASAYAHPDIERFVEIYSLVAVTSTEASANHQKAVEHLLAADLDIGLLEV